MYVNNPFGTDLTDIQVENTGIRVGNRIRKIREEHEPEMTQAQLGEQVNLNASRIQQYESGKRNPRLDLLKQIASALDVQTTALADPDTTNYIGVMYALFEMEDIFGLEIKEIDGKLYLDFNESAKNGSDLMLRNLRSWYDRKKERDDELNQALTEEEKKEIIHSYHMWEWNFPKTVPEGSRKDQQKRRILSQIHALQKQLDDLNKE